MGSPTRFYWQILKQSVHTNYLFHCKDFRFIFELSNISLIMAISYLKQWVLSTCTRYQATICGIENMMVFWDPSLLFGSRFIYIFIRIFHPNIVDAGKVDLLWRREASAPNPYTMQIVLETWEYLESPQLVRSWDNFRWIWVISEGDEREFLSLQLFRVSIIVWTMPNILKRILLLCYIQWFLAMSFHYALFFWKLVDWNYNYCILHKSVKNELHRGEPHFSDVCIRNAWNFIFNSYRLLKRFCAS